MVSSIQQAQNVYACSFCLRCILEWSKISNTCPLCKERFWNVSHKQLDLARAASLAGHGEKFPGSILKTYEIDKKDQVCLSPDSKNKNASLYWALLVDRIWNALDKPNSPCLSDHMHSSNRFASVDAYQDA